VRGKSYLHPTDIDHAMVRAWERFIKKILQMHPVAIPAASYNRGTLVDGSWAQKRETPDDAAQEKSSTDNNPLKQDG